MGRAFDQHDLRFAELVTRLLPLIIGTETQAVDFGLQCPIGEVFESLGGAIETGRRVRSLAELPSAKATLLALTHGQVAELAHSPAVETGCLLRAGVQGYLP